MADETVSNVQRCQVPMWSRGCPDGFCGKDAYGSQLPKAILEYERHYGPNNRIPYCHGACCPDHGGPRADEVRVYMDGYTAEGRPMWCAVMPDFINLQESAAGFDGNPLVAKANLAAEIKADAKPTQGGRSLTATGK